VDVRKELEEIVDNMMIQFCSAKRYAYKRLLENRDNTEFKPQHLDGIVSKQYNLNIRQAKDAIEQARQIAVSQEELLDHYIENYNNKVESILKIFKDKKLSERRKLSLKSKLEKRMRKLEYYTKLKCENKLPKVIFGGKKNFYDRCKGKISNEEYKSNRNNQFVSRGDKSKKGNPNLRVIVKNNMTFLEVSTLEKNEHNRAVKIQVPLYIPQKLSKKTNKINGFDYRNSLLDFINNGGAYQVELLKKNDKYYVHITYELQKEETLYTGHNGILGIDTNIDGFAVTYIDNSGSYREHNYLKEHELTYARGNKRNNLCGELVRKLITHAKFKGCGIAIENLKFSKDKDVKAKLSRKTNQFCYRKLLTILESACYKEGIEFIKVKPQYTSKIGLYKYCHQYGLDIHNGAAMVIGRRSYGFKEKVPKLYKSFFEKNNAFKETKYSNEWANWSNVHRKMKLILRKDCNKRFFIENREDIKNLILV